MKAITVHPGQAGSARVDNVPEPPAADGALLVETIAMGVCGTDREIVSGGYGFAPPGRERLVLGHESLGRVLEAPSGVGFTGGDWIVPIVRRPDPVPCAYCAAGEWDMCSNGQYTERGIKQRDGFGSERFRVEPEFAVKLNAGVGIAGVLVEPASVVAKAWAHTERIGQRSAGWKPSSALITGAGPVGLLAALMAHQRGLAVHVYDRVTGGHKPQLVRDLGATYHGGDIGSLGDLAPDIIIECTGATPVIADAITRTAPSGILCLAGLSSGGRTIGFDLGDVNRRIVLENDTIFGSVNANRTHYAAAAAALAKADAGWLSRLITRRVPVDRWQEALEPHGEDVKTIITFASATPNDTPHEP